MYIFKEVNKIRILLASPRGFCAGVNRAINIVKYVLKMYGSPVYVYHEIVHNDYVINMLRNVGVVFVQNIYEVPFNSILIFSAHGVSKSVQEQAKNRNLIVFDATCPLVKRIHKKVSKASKNGIETILIGHANHPEVKGTIGNYDSNTGNIYLIKSKEDVYNLNIRNVNKLLFVTQTTLLLDETIEIIQTLRKQFPSIVGSYNSDICYATINRQKAANNLASNSDIVFVIGSKSSSNSNRLMELVARSNKPSYLIDNVHNIQKKWLYGVKNIGITSGASSPDILVQQVIRYLYSIGVIEKRELHECTENVSFAMPRQLTIKDNYKLSVIDRISFDG